MLLGRVKALDLFSANKPSRLNVWSSPVGRDWEDGEPGEEGKAGRKLSFSHDLL